MKPKLTIYADEEGLPEEIHFELRIRIAKGARLIVGAAFAFLAVTISELGR